jgi:hypothetical protein
MKKILKFLGLLFILGQIHLSSFAQLCLTYEEWTATKNGNCAVDLHWKYQQSETGKFYVQYSLNASTWYTITIISSTGLGQGEEENYNYTDNYACPGDGSHTHAYYRIDYVRDLSGSHEISSVKDITMGSCSCTNNNTTRCSGLPSLSISGSNTICSSSSQTYTLNNSAYGATWSITSGGSLVSITNSSPTSITLQNSNSNGVIVLSANIYGCTNISKTILVGIPQPYIIYMTYQSSCIGGSDWDASFSPDLINTNISYLWSVNGSGYFSWGNSYSVNQTSDPSVSLNVKYQTSCGTSSPMNYPAIYYSPCSGFRAIVSPNPAKEYLDVKLEEPKILTRSKKIPQFEVRILNSDLMPVEVQKSLQGSNSLRMNIHNLKPGKYFVNILYDNEKVIRQILIQ